jgi:hypothetical protein
MSPPHPRPIRHTHVLSLCLLGKKQLRWRPVPPSFVFMVGWVWQKSSLCFPINNSNFFRFSQLTFPWVISATHGTNPTLLISHRTFLSTFPRYNRVKQIQEMRWEFGSVLPAEIKYNLCEDEVRQSSTRVTFTAF